MFIVILLKKINLQKQSRNESKGNVKTDNIIEDMLYMINTNIDNKIEIIKEFLNKLNNNTRKVNKYISVIEKIDKFNEIGDKLYFNNKDNTYHYTGEYLKNIIFTFCIVLPQIMINRVDYQNMYVPKHWKLSSSYHINDVINIISNEFNGIQKFFDNGEFINFLKKVNDKLLNIYLISKDVPFIPDQLFDKSEQSTFTTKIYIKILKLLLVTCLETMVRNYLLLKKQDF